MATYTAFPLTQEVTEQLDGVAGTLAIANKSTTVPVQVITVILDPLNGPSETVLLSQQGDALTTDTAPYRKVTIRASSYPATILYVIAPAHRLQVTSFSASIAGGLAGGGSLTVLNEARVTVGVAAVELPPITGQRAILVRADPANSSTIYLGASGAVDATGWPLRAGESLPLDLAISLWAIGGAAAQLLHVMKGA